MQSQGGVGFEFFHDFLKRRGRWTKLFRVGFDAVSKKWDSVHPVRHW